jgi:flagellin
MALTVNTNVSALNAQRATLDSQNEMASAMERLASGKRINSARDDAAGLAIAARMESQVSGLNQAVRNANDAISLVQTAEGALQETTAILQRIRELSIQSAGGAPSNADRVNLNKEVVQLQEELARIANTTRFNGGLLLNGSFIDTDFQIGQSNNEEITVSIGDVRPERIGAYTQSTVANVGLVTSGASLNEIDNGVNQQTLVLQVGSEVPRTVAIKKGDDARTISDKMNQAGAQLNSTATTSSDVYVGGYGSFSFKISSSSTPDIQDVITVGATAGSQAAALAAEINRGYSEHNISATLEVDANGIEYVKMVQDDGYDIRIQDYVTTGDSTIDFDSDGEPELTGAYGKTAAVVGGSLTIDAPASFLISSDDELNTILQGTRASLQVMGVSNDPAAYQDTSFDVTVNGVTQTVTLAAPPPAEPRPAQSANLALSFEATPQSQGSSSAQIGAMRYSGLTIDTITVGAGNDVGDETTQFSLNVNGGGANDFDMAQALTDMGYESGDTVTANDFVAAMQTTINANPYYSGNNAVTVSITETGQIQLDVAGGVGSIVFAEHSGQVGGTDGLADTLTGTVRLEDDTVVDLDLGTGNATESITSGGSLVLGSQVNTLINDDGTLSAQVTPFGINSTGTSPNNGITVSTANANQTFTLAINDGAETTITVADGDYFSMAQLAEAVQAGIDNSPFTQTGDWPIVVTATQDENNDWGLTFASADGHSIQVGTTGLLGANGLDIQAPATAPDVGAGAASSFAESKITIGTILVGAGADTGDATTRFSLNVNGGGAEDFDMAQALTDLEYATGDEVDAADFVTAMQATIDANPYFSGDNSVTVSVTNEGLIRLDVAGGAGTLVFAEHSATGANDGLAETLTGTVVNSDQTGVALTAGQATESGSGGFIVLGSTANTAIIANGNDADHNIAVGTGANDGAYVKPFGIDPLVIDGAFQTLIVSINGEAPTDLIIPDGTYFTMDEVAAAVQGRIDASTQLSNRLTVTAVQNTANDSWGLSFENVNGFQVDVYGDFISGSMEVTNGTVATPAAALSAANPVRIAAVTGAPAGPAAFRSEVDAGAYSDGIDLSSDNTVTIDVLDNVTGAIVSKTLTLESEAGSVSFEDYVSLLEAAGNTGFIDEGYLFTSVANEDGTFSISFEPPGDYTVSFAGTSVTQAFGGAVTATGEASNMDGLTFTSMDDVVAELNAQLEALGIPMAATFSRGGDTFNFIVTSGPADASSTIALSGDNLVDLGFTGSLEAIGGGVHRTEEVRYVSQIDISTREGASLAMTVVDAALETLASVRGGLGAVANRLESTISNLMNISENTSASMSRVMDTDFAAESTRLARAQILQEASVAMLAQANQSAQSVLKLLQ